MFLFIQTTKSQNELYTKTISWAFTSFPTQIKTTGATLARRADISLEKISEALTHSDKQVTKTYVNTTDTVNQTVGEIAFRNLKK